MAKELNHFDGQGHAFMVDVGEKEETVRTASARGTIQVSRSCFEAIKAGTAKKGDVLGVARVAGIMGAKRTPELIPLCHVLSLTGAAVEFEKKEETCEIEAVCTVKTTGKTGVEMEALTGVTIALLTIYDMCKALDKEMVIGPVRLEEKTGGKSGTIRKGRLVRESSGEEAGNPESGNPPRQGTAFTAGRLSDGGIEGCV